MKIFVLIALLILATPTKSMARGGTSGVGSGGDAQAIRSLVLKNKREHLIKSVAKSFADSPKLVPTNVRDLLGGIAQGRQPLSNPKAQAILNDMIQKGFARDLEKTKFVLSDACLDHLGTERTAVAKMNAPGTDICVNPARIVDGFGPYIQDSDLIGIMMHEFAHHYGYEDSDHSFAANFAMDYQLDNEERNQDGAPLNYLLK